MVIVLALLGAAVGSFLNVCIDRLPSGQSLINPPSHCPNCQHRLTPLELLPVISYLWLRGRCRHCSAAIPKRTLLVELAIALLFALLWWKHGPSVDLIVLGFYGCLYLMLLVIDLEHGLILNKVVYPAAPLVLVISAFWSQYGIINSLIGGGIGLALLSSIVLLSQGGMGWGDAKMAGLVGLTVGFPLVFLSLTIAVLTGAVMGLCFLLFRLKRRGDTIPFGPFLALGALAALFWGTDFFIAVFPMSILSKWL